MARVVSLLCLIALTIALPSFAQEPVRPLVLRAVIDGAITPVVAAYVKTAIEKAIERKATALVIELDTPGGLMEATRQIVQSILASPVPVIVYVSPPGARAGSAGLFITLASHVAAMAPNTNIGAAHPVSLFGGDIEGQMAKKVENDAAAWAKTLAESHHRNAKWAENAVRKSASISSAEALNTHVIDLIAKDIPHLLEQVDQKLGTKGADVQDIKMSKRQILATWLSQPNLLYLLMMLGFLGIFFEFQHPGLILPGLLGGVCLVFVFGVQILPINWFGAVLLVAAVALLIAEIYVTSFGLLGGAGLALLVAGSYLLFDVEDSSLRVDPVLIWTFCGLFASVLIGFGYLLLRSRRQGAASNVDGLVGKQAIVFETIAAGKPGIVLLDGSYWKAFADETLTPDTKVVVEQIESTQLRVRRIV